MTETDHILRPDESAAVAKALYGPTVKRMIILTQNLVETTASGDFALWVPLATMEQVMVDLKWDATKPLQLQRFLALCVNALRAYAQRLESYRSALAALAPGDLLPKLPEWTEVDTLRVYDDVAALYPAMRTCGLCAGKGEVEETRDASPTDANGGLTQESRFITCLQCGGSGEETVNGVL